jgi:hypothetical protein
VKKTVFISSTFEDLKSHRRKIWELLEKYDVNVRGMEKFGARKQAPLKTCLSEVEQSDIFVGIIAFRLGSVDEASAKSFTQLEYERAHKLNREILIYMIDEKDAKVSLQDIDLDEKWEKLVAFKSILKERHTIDSFVSADDLVQKVKRRFDELLTRMEQSEKPVADEYADSKELIEKFLLVPKILSGDEVKLTVDFIGEPFPVSKALCSSFNLDYGKTIGVPVAIKKPKLEENAFDYVFIMERDLTDYLSLKSQKNVEIYCRLQFSEDEVNNVRANFVRREEYYVEVTNPVAFEGSPESFLGRKKITEADGTIILQVIDIL